MTRLIARALVIGFFVALTGINHLAPLIYRWCDSSQERVASVRVRPRSAKTATTAVVVETPTPATVLTSADLVARRHTRPAVGPSPYDALITRHATRSAVRLDLVRALIQAESGFDPSARSSVGAMGLMQLMPGTAAEMGVSNPYDPDENVRGGIKYLRQLLIRYDGNEELALAAYNAGPGAVARYGNRVPPYPETLKYVAKVRSLADLPVTTRPAVDRAVYRSYAIVDGRWTMAYTSVRPAFGSYEVTPDRS